MMQTYYSHLKHDIRPDAFRRTVLLFLLIVGSSCIFMAGTIHGIGILPDSVAYMRIGSAHHFAPLYTWLLQATTFFGAGITSAAWWLGWGSLVLNILLIYYFLQLTLRNSFSATVLAALIISHPVFQEMHAVAMTEPLYLALVLLSVLAFSAAEGRETKLRLALSGALLGLAMLARFAAAPALPALLLTRLLASHGSLTRRAIDCAVMTLTAVLVFGSWLVASELTSGESTGRSLEFLGRPDLDFWGTTLNAVSVMLLPAFLGFPVRLAFTILICGAVIWVLAGYARWWLRQPRADRSAPSLVIPAAFILISISYAGFLVLSVMLQYRLHLTGRLLLPFYVFVVLAVATACGARVYGFDPGRRLLAVLAVAVGCILASNLARTAIWTESAYRSGLGYASQDWASSPVLQAVSELPPGGVIYSNAPDLIAYRLQRQAEYLPKHFDHLTGRDDPARPFPEQLGDMRQSLEHGGAYVVFVDDVDWRDYLVTEEELLRSVSLVKIENLSDGRIFASASH